MGRERKNQKFIIVYIYAKKKRKEKEAKKKKKKKKKGKKRKKEKKGIPLKRKLSHETHQLEEELQRKGGEEKAQSND